ncbi:FAD dependent oxidoreductase [Vararia minispora EC-137]|uniref:FAD dependent oxidoreductase n=1 Tax=Vararia minispora EC-137 TaxID=1314806 RepID=A0ACB8QM46_9AGAM|nr:FAD dependent oxidoreductase [Vararia minispora EC-137]
MSIALPVPLNQDHHVQHALETWPDRGPASLPVPNPSKSFWIDSSPDANVLAVEGSNGPLTTDVDVCIIGSGITGVSVAYHLAKLVQAKSEFGLKSPVHAVVLEARDFCSGATGRNGGHMSAHGFFDFASDSAAFGVEEAVRAVKIEDYVVDELAKIIRENGLQDTVDMTEGGRTALGLTDAEMVYAKTSYESAKAAGVDVSNTTWLTKEEVRQQYGASFPAFHTPGRNVWPLKLVTHLYRIAKSISPSFLLALHTRTPVTTITPAPFDSPRRWRLQTSRGTISCSYVVHATNGYASYLLPQFSGYNSIVPVRGQIIATRANVNLADLTPSAFIANEGFEYWFPRPVKNVNEKPLVILGGGRETELPHFGMFTTDDSTVNEAVGKVLREFLPSVFPGKFEPDQEPEMEWTGIMGFTPNHDPFVGPVLDFDAPENGAYEGQFIAAGYSGHGMPRAYACAEVVARMVFGELDGSGKWEMPDWLPRHYLTYERTADKPLTRRQYEELRKATDAKDRT